MYISLNWLKDFIDIPNNISAEKFGELLTLHTVEVEGMKNAGKSLANIYVGRIINIEKHPNADKLKLATVDLGRGKHKVVCGGSNLYTGMLVCFAKIGAQVRWHGHEELSVIEPVKIRGEMSEGMICAASEIGLEDMFPAEDEYAVIDLPEEYKLGAPLSQELKLDDVIYDIDNKSMTHRPDLWGHYGMARDASAWFGVKLKNYETEEIRQGKKELAIKVKDVKACPRYMALGIKNISVKPSEDWIKQRLISAGMRPINNIVDITNYVMLELGQPTHAFDAKQFGHSIVVRKAGQGEIIKTLDNQERKLDPEMLVIADTKKSVAIAGIMGAADSEINEETQEVIIESANFDAVSIRKTSQKIGLRTDASQRFEKALDPNMCEMALKKIFSLIKDSCPQAEAFSKVSDHKNFKLNQGPIKFDTDWARRKIGADISAQDIKNILESLGFSVSGGEILEVVVPAWRATKDIAIAEDLTEEVARIYGYNKIKPKMPFVAMTRPVVNKEREFRSKVQDILVNLGMSETYNYAFANEKQLEQIQLGNVKHIKLKNPLTSEHTLLRQSLLPNLLDNVAANQRNFEAIKLFEIGSIFLSEAGDAYKDNKKSALLPKQEMMLGLVYGAKQKSRGDNFYHLKGVVSELGQRFGIEFNFAEDGRQTVIDAGSAPVGRMLAIDEITGKKLGIKTDVVASEIRLSELFKIQKYKKYLPKNKFPYLIRDLAFVVDAKIVYNDIKIEILAADDLIKEVDFFDVYLGDGHNFAAGKKSIAMHVSFGSKNQTLTGEEADKAQANIIKNLKKKFNAQLRNF